MIKKYIMLLAIAAAAVSLTVLSVINSNARQTFAKNEFTVLVDAGHGEPDGGAVGVGGTVEKDINLSIAQKLREVLEGQGVRVMMTREGDGGLQNGDEGSIRKMKVADMKKRRQIMEKSGADLFVSIHMNSFPQASAHGLRVFYDKSHPELEEAAKQIQQRISDVTGAQAYAVKTADEKLFLMKNPPVPSLLIECGFLSNPDEEQKLKTEDYQAKIAWAIAEKLLSIYVY